MGFFLLFIRLVFIFFDLLLLFVRVFFVVQVNLLIVMCVWVVEVVLLLLCLWDALLHLYFVNTEHASQKIGRFRMAQLDLAVISYLFAKRALFWLGIDAEPLYHNG